MNSIGFSQVNISPESDTLLSGFAPLRAYKKKHSDLWLKAVLLENSRRVLFLQFDTIAIDGYLYEKIIEVLAPYQIAKKDAVISATHTHSGPVGLINTDSGIFKGLELFGEYDENYVAALLKKVEQVTKEALADRQELKGIKQPSGRLAGIATERHDPGLPGDDKIVVWQYERNDGKKILFYNFPCHPTILNGTSEYLSADFPGNVAELLSEKYSSVNFINGSCGDISTRFTRKEKGIRQVEIFAGLIAEKIEELLQEAPLQDVETILVKQNSYILKTRDFGSAEQAEQEFDKAQQAAKAATELPESERRIVESFMEGARTNLNFAKSFAGITEIALPITFLKINNEVFVSIPGELFSSLSNPLREKYGVNFLGYTNGYCLYIADREAYEKGYYEALSSIFEKGQGEYLMSCIEKDLLEWITK